MRMGDEGGTDQNPGDGRRSRTEPQGQQPNTMSKKWHFHQRRYYRNDVELDLAVLTEVTLAHNGLLDAQLK
jgi:hypothetical protein